MKPVSTDTFADACFSDLKTLFNDKALARALTRQQVYRNIE